jgi:hypothetical protein
MRNIFTRLNLPDLNQSVSRLRNGLANDVRTLGLTFCPNNIRLPLLLCPLNNEPCPFCILLRDLFLLHGARELASKGHVGDRDVLEGDVEFLGAAQEVGADAVGDGFSLGD